MSKLGPLTHFASPFRPVSEAFGPATLPLVKIEEITRAVRAGEEAAADAGALRDRLRYRTPRGDTGREHDIARAIDSINDAMRPLRSMMGKLVWDPVPDEQERALRAVSARLGYERKQLKKMRAPA